MRALFILPAIILSFTGVVHALPAKDLVKKKVLGLELGSKLPELEVTSQHGKKLPLTAAEGNRWVFVFFYPKALTGG